MALLRLLLLLCTACMVAAGTAVAEPPYHPLLVHNATLLAKTWSLLARRDNAPIARPGLRGAMARVIAEGNGHLHAGPV